MSTEVNGEQILILTAAVVKIEALYLGANDIERVGFIDFL